MNVRFAFKGWSAAVGWIVLLPASLALTGCKGTSGLPELQSRLAVAQVGRDYRPRDQQPARPPLSTNASLADFLTYAMLNHPRVEAAYYDWVAAVERITVERSRPDPRFVFTTDIKDIIDALKFGLMTDLPGPGKLGLRAEAASAESRAKYYAFESSLVQTVYEVKKAYYQLNFLEDKLRSNRETLNLLNELEKLARMQNEIGKTTLQDVLRAQIEQDRLETEIAGLEDSRQPLLSQLRAALGLGGNVPLPPVPSQFESTSLELDADRILQLALTRSPVLQGMAAEVQLAEVNIRLARKGRVPDFSAGLEVDALSSPTTVSPQIGVSLPIWRDKIAADIAAAQARKRASEARLSASQIQLAVEIAEKLFICRESGRNLELLRQKLLPKTAMALEIGRANYVSGKTDFFGLSDLQKQLLAFKLAEVEARIQRELALAELSLLIMGQPPSNAPILTRAPPATQ